MYMLKDGRQATAPWDAAFSIQGRQMVANVPAVRRVGVADIGEIIAHHTLRVADFTSHSLTFRNGGQVHYACKDRGELISLRGTDVQFEVDSEGVVLVHASPQPSPFPTVQE
jgi:hypothetical protein